MSTKPRSLAQIAADYPSRDGWHPSIRLAIEEAAEYGRQDVLKMVDATGSRLSDELLRAECERRGLALDADAKLSTLTDSQLRAECEVRGIGAAPVRPAEFKLSFSGSCKVSHAAEGIIVENTQYGKWIEVTIELPPGGTVKVG